MSKKAKPESKVLILIRHAHRDTKDRSLDNGLSRKGRAQAKALSRHFAKSYSKRASKEGLLLLSSPKLRCVQTVEGIAILGKTRVIQSLALSEQGAKESRLAFDKRIQSVLKWWKNHAPALTLVCSHGDWLPLAIERAAGGRVEMSKGAWAELKLLDGVTQLCGLLQKA